MKRKRSPTGRSYISTPTGVNEEEGLEIACTPTPITPIDEYKINSKSHNPYAAIDIKILEYNKCDLNIVNSTPHSPVDSPVKYPMNVSMGYSSPMTSNYNTSNENINELRLQLNNIINKNKHKHNQITPSQITPSSMDTGRDVIFGDNAIAIANNKYRRKKSKHTHSKKHKTNIKHKKRFNVSKQILNELELDDEQIINSFAPKKPIYNPFAPNNIIKYRNNNHFSEKKKKSKSIRHKSEIDKNYIDRIYHRNNNNKKDKLKRDSNYFIVDNDDDTCSCVSCDNDSILY